MRRAYRGLFEEVEATLARHDPVGIAYVANEYELEVSTILPRAFRATTESEVLQIVREEFEHSFGSDTTMRQDRFEPIAAEVFAAIQRFRTT